MWCACRCFETALLGDDCAIYEYSCCHLHFLDFIQGMIALLAAVDALSHIDGMGDFTKQVVTHLNNYFSYWNIPVPDHVAFSVDVILVDLSWIWIICYHCLFNTRCITSDIVIFNMHLYSVVTSRGQTITLMCSESTQNTSSSGTSTCMVEMHGHNHAQDCLAYVVKHTHDIQSNCRREFLGMGVYFLCNLYERRGLHQYWM